METKTCYAVWIEEKRGQWSPYSFAYERMESAQTCLARLSATDRYHRYEIREVQIPVSD